MITMRAVVEIEEDNRGRTQLVITELPYQVNPDNLAQKIADLHNDGRVQGIADIRDESSGRTGQRLVIMLRRDAVAKVVLNNLYKHTQLQDTFGANMLALVDGVPRTLSLDAFVRHWVDHQVGIIVQAHALPAAQGRGARPHPARSTQGAGRDRRGDRAHPAQRHRRGRAGWPDGAARDRRAAGAGDPRHAAAQAGRAGAAEAHRRIQRADGADLRLQRDPRLARAAATHHQRRARRDHRAVRRCPAHAADPVRRRHVDPGPHRRGRRRRHDHPRRLRQAHQDRPLPRAAARRPGRARRGAATGRHRRALLRDNDARLDPVLHQQGPGLPREGVRAARGGTRRPRPTRREPARVPAGRAHRPGTRSARLCRGAVPRARAPAGAW